MNKIYDYHENHKYFKKISVAILGSITALCIIGLLISEGSIAIILPAIFFSCLLYKALSIYKGNKKITFSEDFIDIDWVSMNQTVKTKINTYEIKKINFGVYSMPKSFDYTVELYTNTSELKLHINMIHRGELKPYFKEFCLLNNIELDGI